MPIVDQSQILGTGNHVTLCMALVMRSAIAMHWFGQRGRSYVCVALFISYHWVDHKPVTGWGWSCCQSLSLITLIKCTKHIKLFDSICKLHSVTHQPYISIFFYFTFTFSFQGLVDNFCLSLKLLLKGVC